MEGHIAVFTRPDPTALLSVEVVLARFPSQKLATFGAFEALSIRLIRFHRHIKLFILPIFQGMSRPFL